MPKQTFPYGTRRDFVKFSSLLAGGVIVGAPYFARTQKINIHCIGVGGKGDSDSSSMFGLGASRSTP